MLKMKRTRFPKEIILLFAESVGLRSSELLGAQLKDWRLEPEGWVMQIHGKVSKNLIMAVLG
jgi:integrase